MLKSYKRRNFVSVMHQTQALAVLTCCWSVLVKVSLELHSHFNPTHTFIHNDESESLTTTNMNACLLRNLSCVYAMP